MKKGCVIGLVVFAVIAAAVVIAALKFGPGLMNKGKEFASASQLFAVEESAKNYLKANPETVPATNEEWVTALQGTDYDTITVQGQSKVMEVDGNIADGKFKDMLNGQEMSITVSGEDVTAVLPGADGELGTADDVTSASVRKLMK